MNYFKNIIIGLFVTLACLAAAEQPNIILIMTDDQGIGDLGSTGNPVFDTPNIDALGTRSAKLSRFYVSPVCSPTRASLMTGRYNYRTKVVDTWKGRSMMAADEFTLAEALKAGGYATGIFGKWHLGDCYPLRAIDQGFDEALVHNGGGLGQPADPIENKRRYTDPILFHNGKQVQTKGYCTDVYFDAAMKYIEKQVSAKKPFFTYIAPNAPHGPFHDVPMDLYHKYMKKDMSAINFGKPLNKATQDKTARIAAMIENIDINVGRLWQKLNALKITQNTILIFMVDNGPNTRRFVGKLRGNKTHVHEGGIRSPFYFSWPAKLKPGVASDRMAAHIDVLPTLLDAAGIDLPKDRKIDGMSLMPLLSRQKVDWPDRSIIIQTHRGSAPIAYHHFALITDQYKLLKASGFGNEKPKDAPFELYDIQADSMESKNLAESKPEVFKRLKAEYDKLFKDVSSTRPGNYEPPVIILGTDYEPETLLTLQDAQSLGGKGWGSDGYWLLKTEKKQSFEITLRWLESVPDGSDASIEFNGKKLKAKVKANKAVFENVELPTETFKLRAVSTKGKKFARAWHVIVKRK